jgi:hypothetical protein
MTDPNPNPAPGAATNPNPASGTPANPNPAPAAGGTPNPAPKETIAWLGENVDEETVGYVKNKAWQGPADVVKSYREFEKFRGMPLERIAEIPQSDDPAAWDALYTKIGRPKEPKEYEIEAPQEGADERIINFFRDAAHKVGLNKHQAKAMSKMWNEAAGQWNQSFQTEQAAKAQAEDKELRSKWGASYDQRVELGKKAAAALGMPVAAITTLQGQVGYAPVMELFATIGEKLGSDALVVGDDRAAGGFIKTPAQAKAELQSLNMDKDFMEAWMNKGHPKHKEAVERKSRLTQLAYPEG